MVELFTVTEGIGRLTEIASKKLPIPGLPPVAETELNLNEKLFPCPPGTI